MKIFVCFIALLILACPIHATNVALGSQYAYLDKVPGEGAFYQDDTHAVHTSGLGVFSTGQLTDGINQPGVNQAANIPSPVVSYLGTPGRIIFDLGATFVLESISLGTHQFAGFANFRPENVNILFSTTNTSSFGAPLLWDIPTNTTDGQITFSLNFTPTAARFVQLDFATPGGQPNEIHFDEVGLFSNSAAIPEPATVLFFALASLLCLRLKRK